MYQQNDQDLVPSAPYPPMHSAPVVRSSLSSSPHYRQNNRVASDSTGTTISSNNSNGSFAPVVNTNTRDGNSESENESFAAATPRPQFLESSSSPKPIRPSLASVTRVKFFPSMGGTLACINTASTATSHSSTAVEMDGDETQRNRKLGPVLMELRQLELIEEKDSRADELFFDTRTIALSRGNPQLGISVASTCLDLPVVQSYAGSKPRFAAATGLTTGMLAIHTFSQVMEADGLPYSSAIEYYHISRHHRQSSAVAWRTNQSNHVAIGLLGSGNPGPQQVSSLPRRGGAAIRGAAGGGDREFCCFVWDIEAQQSAAKRNAAPISKLSHNTPVASLAWVLDGQTLAVGTQSRNVQLYDMRASGANAPPLSALAHNFGVHGIEVDPNKPNIMATFCRSVGEPVKLWDVRRMDSVVSEIKVSGSTAGKSSAAAYANQVKVEAVKWSTADPGVLSVAIGDSVQDYDTSSGSRPVLVMTSFARRGRTIQDFALYGKTPNKAPIAVHPGTETASSSRLVDALYSRRMVAVLEDKTVCDLAAHGGVAPVAISRRDGRLAHAMGSTVWVGSTTFGPSAMENATVSYDEDISATMMRRARCSRMARYSMNTSQNIKMLSEDIPSGAGISKDVLLSRLSLFRLWSWIERVEALSTDFDEVDGDVQSPLRSLLDAGILQLFSGDGLLRDDVVFSETLSCNVYLNVSRILALTSCGWAGKFSLEIVLAECEALGEYERSAALAVWHGDIGAAVEALQRASKAVRDNLAGTKNLDSSLSTPEYAETLDLIAMCVAGFGGTSSAQSSVWQNACAKLIQRRDLSDPRFKTSRTVYLHALCYFLLNVGTERSFDYILGNEFLAYGDRIAFACRFLDQTQLQSYLYGCLEKCQQVGNVEGLVISGLSKEGIKILQAFVDRTADVQTAALVVSRVLLPPDWTDERKICTEWVETYRGLLNTWQMWQSRAMFDVDRAEAIRRLKAKGNDHSGPRRIQNRRQGSRVADADGLTSIPAALDARCNYCSSPLGLKRHEGNANQWLSKMKPVLSCCPQCRKPLPRCAICLLSLGALNPYMQLTRERSRPIPRGGGNAASGQDDLGALPLAEWFTWCMNCKHGGHAHHLVGWFANHETCPVSGCDCFCQFDGIQKLSRPALAKRQETAES